MKKYQIKLLRIITVCLLLALWFSWDFTQADKHLETTYKSYKVNSSYDAISGATTTVTIVRSNDDSLAHPVAVDDATIDYQTIEEMVRRVYQISGSGWY